MKKALIVLGLLLVAGQGFAASDTLNWVNVETITPEASTFTREKGQILRHKEADGIERERHVYSGPQGDGYIDYEYKTVGKKQYVKCTHVGPEARESFDWREIGNAS